MSIIDQANTAYESGNYETAFNMLLPLAKAGGVKSQISIASMYSTGNGVETNLDEAIKWFYLAAQQGHPLAQNNLAILLFAQNPEESIKWLSSAAKQSVCAAQSMLGDIYSGLYNLPPELKNKFNDEVEATKWYEKAGKGSFSYAYHRLGDMYANGQGVVKDEKKAFEYYQLAASMGYEPSQKILAEASQVKIT